MSLSHSFYSKIGSNAPFGAFFSKILVSLKNEKRYTIFYHLKKGMSTNMTRLQPKLNLKLGKVLGNLDIK